MSLFYFFAMLHSKAYIKEGFMDIQLSELIEKIKKDGIESAQKEATKLKNEAEAEAKRIITEAKQEAEKITSSSKEEAKRNETAGIAALEQAARNLILAFKAEIQALLNNITAEAVSSVYSADVLKEILPVLVKNWAEKNTDSLSVLLSEKDLAKLDNNFKAALAASLKRGVEIKAVKKIEKGFNIVEKDGAAFYDFSAEAVAAMLSSYLNPKLSKVLNKAEGI